ncbi:MULTISPECIES: nucleotide disphospho-sugar-binding domain-containing protein [Streptosporangium]|uniref:UDP:flavonoid glycosyltransferase YjiC (YdhE family) n=1 Tax=Streptosporangium brasiliense TaxID=47480 RepID=A0ABT9R346_9ACTN|nr:nucleotide disphospho-sugar-binding domain-containing protein [Streptosporangium brasiliense]MDP9863654.1 UDP:flavonoid glycosyltransferase YjiC (YdhE family) [Streptosporangium brasiliense]
MKILFISGPTKSSVFGLAPLAIAARGSGHQVVLASTREAVSAALGIGVPAFSTTPLSLTELMTLDRAGEPLRIPQDEAELPVFVGHMFGRLAAAGLDPLRDLVTGWRPDLIVGGPHAYVAPLLSAEFGLPCVRHLLTGNAIDREGTHPGVEEELRPELDRLGLDHVPGFDMAVDIFPESTRPDGATPAQPMRWIPTNEQCPLQPWMCSRGERRRVLVTAGSLATPTHNFGFLRGLTDALTELDVEVVIAAPEEVGEELRAERGVAHAGWVPMDVVLPTCDLIVHHSGTMTALTALHAGVPQLIIPQESRFTDWARMLSARGVAMTLPPGQDTPDAVAAAGRELLGNPSYTEGARAIAREIAEMPLPAEVLGVLEKLVTA